LTIGLFQTTKTIGQTLATNLIELFNQCRLRKKIIAYVKDERSNLITMTTTLKSVMKCEISSLNESFQGTSFGHVFLKTC
jgi:hypothetical protein